MKKLGTTDGKALVSLSSQEFSGLAGATINNTPDGESISLAPIQAKIALVDAKEAELAELKVKCQEMEALITSIGV